MRFNKNHGQESSVVNHSMREFYTFYEKISLAQKAQKAQKVTFFILDLFMRTKSTKSTRRQTSGFFLSDVFTRTKMLSFLFLFAYVRFVLFMPNKRLFSS